MSDSIKRAWIHGRKCFVPNAHFYGQMSKKARAHSSPSADETYWDHVTNEASLLRWALEEEAPDDMLLRNFTKKPGDSRLSIETQDNSTGSLDIKTFTQGNTDKAVQLLSHLRPEFLEIFLEFYLLEKYQSFIGEVHGCVHTRIWQTLRIVEQAIGAIIVLGANPTQNTLRPILEQNQLEQTKYGSLAYMIDLYARTQSYTAVAKTVHAPVPAIRKVFRPAITTLLAGRDIRSAAVGCYLRGLTHQASLTRIGLSKSATRRLHRVHARHFTAPAMSLSPLFNFGRVAALGDTPWAMLEISSDHRMAQLIPQIESQGKRIFGKTPAQIFAPVNADGDLLLGYIFARCLQTKLAYSLRQIRGITELSAIRDEADRITKVVTVPHAELLPTITKEVAGSISAPKVRVGDFVRILTGKAANYCGTVVRVRSLAVYIEVNFPSGRVFHVTADATAVKLLPTTPFKQRAFWGARN